MELIADSLTRRYGTVVALAGLSLRIENPGVFVILGPNGAGKTTFMKIITGLVKPSAGSLKINGLDSWGDHSKVSEGIGALIEQPEFHPYMTGREILEFHSRVKGISGIGAEVERVAGITEISEYLDRKSGGYSRGMKQRLALASALLGDPELLVLDEPTFGLDPLGMIMIRKIIKKLSTEMGKTVILSTHLIFEASELADRVLIFSRGRLVYDNPSDHTRKLEVEVAGDASPLAKIDATIQGNTAYFQLGDPSGINGILSGILKTGLAVTSIREIDGLEEIYVKMQGGKQQE
jgi:ABC-2 type transport system ATP-binding protein